MKLRHALGALICTALGCSGIALAPAAAAQDSGSNASQWRASQMTLATLLQNGFRMVSVLPSQGGQTYYLQRDQSAFRCVEQNGSSAVTACYELAQPDSPPSQRDTTAAPASAPPIVK